MSDQTEPDGADQSQRSGTIPPDLYAIRITANRETINKLMRSSNLDLGCRPHPEEHPDGTGTLLAYATAARIRELKAEGYEVEQGENISALGRERQNEVGKGDRYEGGRVLPRGLGHKPGRDGKGGTVS
jgi:hypothetical protein